jgi:hypothetical protein
LRKLKVPKKTQFSTRIGLACFPFGPQRKTVAANEPDSNVAPPLEFDLRKDSNNGEVPPMPAQMKSDDLEKEKQNEAEQEQYLIRLQACRLRKIVNKIVYTSLPRLYAFNLSGLIPSG